MESLLAMSNAACCQEGSFRLEQFKVRYCAGQTATDAHYVLRKFSLKYSKNKRLNVLYLSVTFNGGIN